MSENQVVVAPRRITLGFVIGWGWAIFAAVGGLAEIVEGKPPLVGACMIASAALACPLVHRFFEKHGLAVSGWVYAAAVITLVIVGGSLLPSPRLGETAPASSGNDAPPPSAPERPVEAKQLLSIDGSGDHSTETFTTQGSEWTLHYTYDCSNFEGRGNFMIDIKSADGSYNDLAHVNELGAGGSDTEHYHSGGTFYLQINSECTWHVGVMG